MLHEILLALSGHPSPLLPSPTSKSDPAVLSQTFPLLSPPEKALLSSLAWLSELHKRVRSYTFSISSSHPSIICRAVSTTIDSTHLDRFQQKIVEVEKQMLRKDGGSPNEYEIMPLSLIVGEFEEWTRRMEWFWEIVQYMMPIEAAKADRNPDAKGSNRGCSGALIIEKLRKEARTGFPDIHEAAIDLSRAAETAWLRQLSSWVLYGRLPRFGAEDFFIHETTTTSKEGNSKATCNFIISEKLLPQFVTRATASSILFIGKSLNHIRMRANLLGNITSPPSSAPELALLSSHLSYLSSLSSPLSASSLSRVIANIRLSLSQNTLQQLLPVPKILELLAVLRDFFLLGRGEFAAALITEADGQLNSRYRQTSRTGRGRPGDELKGLLIKDGEVNAILARTWAALSSYISYDSGIDDRLELARDLVHLTISKSPPEAPRGSHQRDVDNASSKNLQKARFNDLLLSTPVDLTLSIPSPLDLFLSEADMQSYSRISAYLLSIRRAHHHLTSLWKHSTLRRSHPAPFAPPYSNSRKGAETNQRKRQRECKRARDMRKIWATCGATVFLLSEMESYLQGEVVEGSWDALRLWIEGPFSVPETTSHETERSNRAEAGTIKSSSSTKARLSTPNFPQISSSTQSSLKPKFKANEQNNANEDLNLNIQQNTPRPHDPETLSRAHRAFLTTLLSSLLLTDRPYTAHLRSTLAHIDHLVALVTRLQTVQQNLDLEADEAIIVDALADHVAEERALLTELEGARERVERASRRLVGRLREYDAEGSSTGQSRLDEDGVETDDDTGTGAPFGDYATGESETHFFVPFAAPGVDRLLMKLDFGSLVAEGDVLGQDHVGFD